MRSVTFGQSYYSSLSPVRRPILTHPPRNAGLFIVVRGLSFSGFGEESAVLQRGENSSHDRPTLAMSYVRIHQPFFYLTQIQTLKVEELFQNREYGPDYNVCKSLKNLWIRFVQISPGRSIHARTHSTSRFPRACTQSVTTAK